MPFNYIGSFLTQQHFEVQRQLTQIVKLNHYLGQQSATMMPSKTVNVWTIIYIVKIKKEDESCNVSIQRHFSTSFMNVHVY